jgi:hypothetical protein
VRKWGSREPMAHPGLCVIATLILVDNTSLRRTWTTALAIVMFVLTRFYTALVHTPEYIGVPIYWMPTDSPFCLEDKILKQVIVDDAADYSEGWLRDSELIHNPMLIPMLSHQISTHHISRFWHTWLTGLYSIRTTTCELWYPGGKLRDAIDQIEYRIRDPQ